MLFVANWRLLIDPHCVRKQTVYFKVSISLLSLVVAQFGGLTSLKNSSHPTNVTYIATARATAAA